MSYSPSLSEMPEVVMKRILEKSDFRSIFTLRKVSRNLHDFIDDTIPDIYLDTIEVFVTAKYIWARYKTITTKNKMSTQKFCRIHYKEHEHGCLIETANEKSRIVDGKDFVTAFCDDFINILKHQKSILSYFTIGWADTLNEPEDLEPIAEKIMMTLEVKVLKPRKRQLQVRNIRFDAVKQSQVMTILPYIDPRYLRTIGISNPNINIPKVMEIGEIVKLEQWKNARELFTPAIIVSADTRHLCHFDKADVSLQEISVSDVVVWKEKFLHSSSFKSFFVRFERLPEREELVHIFGPPSIDDGNDQKLWLFNTPNLNKTLKIDSSSKAISFFCCN